MKVVDSRSIFIDFVTRVATRELAVRRRSSRSVGVHHNKAQYSRQEGNGLCELYLDLVCPFQPYIQDVKQ